MRSVQIFTPAKSSLAPSAGHIGLRRNFTEPELKDANMPDISMCNHAQCTVKDTCYRNAQSGTKPTEYRQAFMILEDTHQGDEKCQYYWPIRKPDEAAV
jgi:hypothetical protein